MQPSIHCWRSGVSGVYDNNKSDNSNNKYQQELNPSQWVRVYHLNHRDAASTLIKV